ncbi:MAG: hypothetical protein LBS84_11490 [Clostridiales bacterium]|jgi:hypothetical protein|nr:hypothetical protein [Clostridiales bacterium]
MNALFNGKMKYLFLAPIAIMIIFALLNQQALAKLQDDLLTEKMAASQAAVDQLVELINRHVDLGFELDERDYERIFRFEITHMDSSENVFAGLYDEEMHLVTKRVSMVNFNPTHSQDFTSAILENPAGWIEVPYEREDSGTIDMHIYYRWFTGIPAFDKRYLVAVGVSMESISINPASWLTTGMIVQILVTFLLNMAFVVLLCYLGNIYSSRNGRKWRPGG